MSETQTKDKPAAKSAAKNDPSAFANFEVPGAMREFAEKGVKQAKDAYENYKSMAEEATESLEDAFATLNKSTTEFQSQAIRATKANVDASFDHVEKLVGVKSVAELLELQTAFARQQFEALSGQAREFQAMASRFQAESTKPFNEGVSKAMSQWKQAV